MNQEKIGKFIAKCRKEKNMTQQELANHLGITDKAISKWENGRCLPDISLIKDLCQELDITMNELLNGNYITAEDIKEKSEETLSNTFTYIHNKENKRKKRTILAFLGIIIISSLICFNIVKNEYRKNYYSLKNLNILFEQSVDNIKNKMDEICNKDENGNWTTLKNSNIPQEETVYINELIEDMQECYNYLTQDKNINLLRIYTSKGHVSKSELAYLNSIAKDITCLNTFEKYKESSYEDSAIKMSHVFEKIYSLQETTFYHQDNLTFAELTARVSFEASVISQLSDTLYTKYY